MYAVLLYPPVGVPRVIEVPAIDKKLSKHFPVSPLATFNTRASAEKALEKFLKENPEYRTWKDGSLHPDKAGLPK